MTRLLLKYRSGEEIKKGDRVLFHREPGEIDFVACDPEDHDPGVRWHMQEFGGGVGVRDAIAGLTFISADQIDEYEDLEFVGRASG